MTENEAIKVFKELLDVPCEMLVKYDSVATEEQKKALVKIRVAEDIAIQALEEIQQYRAIGTVEDWQKLIEKEATERRKLEEYFMFGSVEEFKVLKEKSVAKKPLLRLCGDCQRGCTDCDRYEDRCPTCNGGLYVDSGKPHEHCPHCGQKLDWSE